MWGLGSGGGGGGAGGVNRVGSGVAGERGLWKDGGVKADCTTRHNWK